MAFFGQSTTKRFIAFGLVGFSGVFVNLGGLYLLADVLGAPLLLSSAMAIEVSIVWNFLFNNAFTFQDKNARARASFFARMFRYNVASLIGLAVQLTTFALASRALVSMLDLSDLGTYKYGAQLLGIVLGMGVNFATNVRWTWQEDPKSASKLRAPSHVQET